MKKYLVLIAIAIIGLLGTVNVKATTITFTANEGPTLTWQRVNDSLNKYFPSAGLTISGTFSSETTNYEPRYDLSFTAIITSGITSIGASAFFDCRNLTSVTFPAGLTSIDNNAFFDCRNLTSVTFPAGLTSIGNSAFRSCITLESVTIPSSVINIS